jgi:methionyl-tRNA formyltransferase
VNTAPGASRPPLRVLFAGTPEVALPALEALVADARIAVVGVLTNPDRPRGRSARPRPSPVAEAALRHGLPLIQPERPVEALEDIRATGAEVGAVVAYGAILPPAVLEALPLGFVNLHLSLLPRWRGAAPVQHAIAAMDPEIGVSVFRLDRGMDTGPLLRRHAMPLHAERDAGEVLDELALLGAPLLVEGLLALAGGEIARPQEDEGVTLAPKLTPQDAVVDWTLTAREVAARIRSVSPRPGAVTTLRGARLKVADPQVVDAALAGVPEGSQAGERAEPRAGSIVSVTDGPVVACGQGAVRLGRLQPEGRRWVSGPEFVSGQRVGPGELLGSPTEGATVASGLP